MSAIASTATHPTARTRVLGSMCAAALLLTLLARPAAAASPTFETFTDPPSDDLVVDCGGYEIREVSTFSARIISYPNGTSRMLATIDGWLYRSDDPDTVIGREHARTVRAIDGTVAAVTGNRWHVVLYGAGMSVHDVGRLVFDFETREVFFEAGSHPVFEGTFDFESLCEA